MAHAFEVSLSQLSQDVSDLCLPLDGLVPELPEVPSPGAFLRDWCSPNKPFVVRGAARHWRAVQRWTPEYFRERYGEKEVTVAVTPSGYADAIAGDFLALPEERRMTVAQFLDILHEPTKHNGVFYIQKQNSNLSAELPELFGEVPGDIAWVTEALNKQPDAVNFWMGDGRAVTSLHKDHYENVYCVISGYKDIVLLPPTDRSWLPHRRVRPATYREEAGVFRLRPEPGADAVPWADWDPRASGDSANTDPGDPADADPRASGDPADTVPRASGHPLPGAGDPVSDCGGAEERLGDSEATRDLLKDSGDGDGESCRGSGRRETNHREVGRRLHPLRCRLEAGDLLYLPALWFHHLQQSHGCVAVNYWYDMEFDIKYCYFKFLETLSEARS